MTQTKKWSGVLINNKFEEIELKECTYFCSTKIFRELLQNLSHKTWGGKEGKTWRIVSDKTIIGFHSRNVSTGEVIEIR